nr:MAG TPA: hypothetical protein [Caudoviricetes sp.]
MPSPPFRPPIYERNRPSFSPRSPKCAKTLLEGYRIIKSRAR